MELLSSEFYMVNANYIVLGIYCTLNIRVYCLYSVCLLIGWGGHGCNRSRAGISQASTGQGENSQGFIVAEKQILLEVDSLNILKGLITLLASYYVFYASYPKSGPAPGTLLFLQEVALTEPAKVIRKPARYSSLSSLVYAVFL